MLAQVRSPSHSSPSARLAVGPLEATVVALLLTLHVLLIWSLRSPDLTIGNDHAWYMLLARSIRHLAYENLQFVAITPHTKYPPGYPALLALLDVTSFERYSLGIALNAALSAGTLALVHSSVRPFGRAIAAMVLATCAVNPLMISIAGSVSSEPLFMAFSALAVVALSAESPRGARRSLAIVALVAAALTRIIGVTAILAVLLLWIRERQWRWALTLSAVSLLTVGVWLGWSVVMEARSIPGQSYFADLVWRGPRATDAPAPSLAPSPATTARRVPVRRPRDVISGVLAQGPDTAFGEGRPLVVGGINLPTRGAVPSADRTGQLSPAANSYWRVLARRAWANARVIPARRVPTALAVPVRASTRIDSAAWLLLATLLAVSGVFAMRRAPAPFVITGAYLALLVIWPFLLLRYFAPAIPGIVTVLLIGAHALGRRAGFTAGWSRMVIPGLATTALLFFAARSDLTRARTVAACDRGRAAASPACFSPDQRAYFAAAAEVRRLPDDRENFLVSQEAPFHLLTGRYAAWEAEASRLRDPAQLADYLERNGVSYIVLSRTNRNQWSMAKPLSALCHRLRTLQTFGPHAALLRFGDATAPGADACAVVASWAAAPWPDGPASER